MLEDISVSILVVGAGLASVWDWLESLTRKRIVRLKYWFLIRLPQGMLIAWALKILGAY
jgi:hypothetical protein